MVQQRYGAVLKSMQRRHVECATQSDDVELLGGPIGYNVLPSSTGHHQQGTTLQVAGGTGKGVVIAPSCCTSTQTPDWSSLSGHGGSIRSIGGGGGNTTTTTSPGNNRSSSQKHPPERHSPAAGGGGGDCGNNGANYRGKPQQQDTASHRSGSSTELSMMAEIGGNLTKKSSGELAQATANEEGQPKETAIRTATGLWDRHNGGQIITDSAGDIQL